MKKVFVILLACISFVSLAFQIQGQQKDIKGWRDTRWGMNEDQILALFKGQAIKLDEIVRYDKWYASICIPNYVISDLEYTVHFLIDKKSKTLQQVNIFAAKETLSTLNIAFRQLEQVLTEKYGPPSFKKNEGETKKVVWNFPSTIIELVSMDMQSIHFKNLSIVYRPPTKDRDKI